MERRSDNRILYALTGRPGCGKTTAILKIVEELKNGGVEVDGMYTEELRVGGRRVGFMVKRIGGGEGILAHVNLRDGPRLGRYRVNLADLERIGVSAILDGIRDADVVVVDEVGPMELFSRKFRDAVERLLSSDKHAVLTVHYRSRDRLAMKVRRLAGENLITLNQMNRDKVPGIIVGKILEALGKR